MRGVGFRPRIPVRPQPVLCWCDGVAETKRSALSPDRINIARACWDRTGYVLLARAHMGLSRQLPILQLRSMHGHRERYCFLLRDQSPVPVRAPAGRHLSGPILSGGERPTHPLARPHRQALRSLTGLNPGDAEIGGVHGCSRLITIFCDLARPVAGPFFAWSTRKGAPAFGGDQPPVGPGRPWRRRGI